MMKKMNLDRRLMLTLAAVTALGTQHALGAGIWNVGTGNWSTGTNWDDSNVPSAVAVTLGDVASGTRTVTYNSSNPSVTTLTMSQSTDGATNELLINGYALQLAGTTTGATQNLFNQTVTGGAISVSVTNGGEIGLTNDTSTSSATKYFNNRGTLNLGDASTAGSITFTNATGSRNIASTVYNTGTMNLRGAFITRPGTTANLVIATGYDGTNTNTNAEMNFLSGTSVLGNVDVASSGNARSQALANYGKLNVSNGAIVRLNSNVTSSGGTATWTLTNKAGGTLTQGSALATGNGEIRLTTNSTSNTNNMTVLNEGTWNTYGQSALANASSSASVFSITNATGATWNLIGDATGVTIGWSRSSDFSMTNAGTLNVQRFTGTGSGATGLATLGNFSTAYNTSRGGFILNSDVGSQVNVDVDAVLKLRTKSAANNYKTNTINNSGTVTLGSSGSTTDGGAISFLLGIGSGNANSDNVNQAHAARFANSGTTRLYGTSSIAVDPASIAVNDATNSVPFFVVNNSGATIDLYDSASIGQTGDSTQNSTVGQSDYVGSKPIRTLFSNAGTVNKVGNGAASILSASGGSASNTGTIDVQAGSLEFSSALSNNTGGLIKGNGTLITPTLTSVGTIAPGASVGNLAITGDVVVGDSGVVAIEVVNDTFDVLAIDGDLNLSSLLDTLTVTATEPMTLTRRAIITYTGDLTGQFNTETLTGFSGAASIDYSVAGEIAVVVPEPASLALIGLAGLGLLRRRR